LAKTTLWYSNDDKHTFASYNKKIMDQIKTGFSLPKDEYPGFNVNRVINNETLNLDSIRVSYSLYKCGVVNSVGKPITFSLIIFDEYGKVGFIIEKTSDALRILRLLFCYGAKDRMVIEQESYPSNSYVEEIFFSIINKLYRKQGKVSIDVGNKKLNFDLSRLDSVKGRASTSGSLNSVSTQGNDVINMLSTMSFLLETAMLSDITIALSFNKNKNITVSIHTNNSKTNPTLISVDVYEKQYSGYLRIKEHGFQNTDIDFQKLRARLLIIAHLEIIPLVPKALPLKNYSTMKDLLNKKIINDLGNELSKMQDTDQIV
jgi:hypothetical protein